MASSATTSQIDGIYESLGQLIQNPKSLGLREHLPPRVLAVLTSTREMLLEQINGGKQTAAADNNLAAELSQDSDTRLASSEEQQRILPFDQLLCRRMDQLHLSTHDVAVILGCTIQYIWDLRRGLKAPTELHIAELGLLLGETRESLKMAVGQQNGALMAAV
jgi:hypothetical protein